METVSSALSWLQFAKILARLFNIYLPDSLDDATMLQAQWRLSTDSKTALPFDLTTQRQYESLLTIVRPLVVPKTTMSGKPSARKMKAVTVQIFNKCDVLGQAQSAPTNKKVSP
jgi:hypothetical protein